MKTEFIKMHGIGNDYIYIDAFKYNVQDADKLAVKLCERRFGIGSDGLVLIAPSDKADARMIMYNADGSESENCGNALRCIAKYIYENGIAPRSPLRIETLSGIYTAVINKNSAGQLETVTLEIGEPSLKGADISDAFQPHPYINHEFDFGFIKLRGTLVSVGNPHLVIYTENAETIDIENWGPKIESHPLFSRRVNIEFVQIISRREVIQRTWERGSGETWACGTGAAAVCTAGIMTDVRLNMTKSFPAAVTPAIDYKSVFAGVLGYAVFTLMDTLVKIVSSRNSLFFTLFLLNLFAFVYYCMFFSVTGWKRALTRNIKFHQLRGVVNIGLAITVMYSFSQLPLGYVYAVMFSVPFITSLLGAGFLGDKVTVRTWIAMLTALIGILVALRPWETPLTLTHLITVIGAFMGALSAFMLKAIKQVEHPISIAFYGSIFMAVFFGILTPFFWQPMVLNDILIMLLAGLLMATAAGLVTHGFVKLKFSTMGTIQYSQFIWGMIFSYIFFAEIPSVYFYIGALLIVTAGMLNAGSRIMRIKWL
ncbi:hypothetical protein CHS0354_002011 [Potamilus streckersoni]|uniref:diaminopimelate epimerase n=1 Tax=Potamilus streckersoni TaxID=2493646 RepID=A0AAE0T656_9BIVA|nr:hypothetical protein CHS0354_002011 [Potamilus streckersoni]